MSKSPLGMILSAGFGTRLLPLTQLRPKTVMEMGVYSSIYYLIKMLESSGVKEVVINLHYLPDQVIDMVERLKVNLKIHFLWEEEILGTAGAIKNAIKKLNIAQRKMVIMHGDIVCDLDLATQLNSKQFCTLICATDQTIDGYVGSVSVDENGFITELGRFFTGEASKVQAGFFTGIHILSQEAVELIGKSEHRCLVSEVYPDWLRSGFLIKGSMQDVYFADLGSPERLWAATMKLFDVQKKFRFIDPFVGLGTDLSNPSSYFGKNIVISPTAKIINPVIIADGASIGPLATIGPHVVIGKQSLVEAGACIKRSLVMSDTMVKKGENLDCVIALSHARVEVRQK